MFPKEPHCHRMLQVLQQMIVAFSKPDCLYTMYASDMYYKVHTRNHMLHNLIHRSFGVLKPGVRKVNVNHPIPWHDKRTILREPYTQTQSPRCHYYMNELLKFSMANREITEAQIFVLAHIICTKALQWYWKMCEEIANKTREGCIIPAIV